MAQVLLRQMDTLSSQRTVRKARPKVLKDSQCTNGNVPVVLVGNDIRRRCTRSAQRQIDPIVVVAAQPKRGVQRGKKRLREEKPRSSDSQASNDHAEKREDDHAKLRATVPEYQSRLWKLSQRLKKQKPLWDDNTMPLPPIHNPSYNVRVMERTLLLKLVAGLEQDALEFCHDVLLSWYGDAAKKLSLLVRGSSSSSTTARRDMEFVRDGIARMWCLYAQVVSRVLRFGDETMSKLLLDVATSCPLVRNHSIVIMSRLKFEFEQHEWIGTIHCNSIKGFANAVQPFYGDETILHVRDETILQVLSSGIRICNNAVQTFNFSHCHQTSANDNKVHWNETFVSSIQESISALGHTVASLRSMWPQSYQVIDSSSAIIICKEANRLSRIKEAISNLEHKGGMSETINFLKEKVVAIGNSKRLKMGDDGGDSKSHLKGSKLWDIEYGCRCFARFPTEQELRLHTRTCQDVSSSSEIQLLEYGCKYCSCLIFETEEKLWEHESECHGVDSSVTCSLL